MNLYYETYESPIGEICIITTEEFITHLLLFKKEWLAYIDKYAAQKGSKLGQLAIFQLREYFQGERKNFDLPLALEGTDYQLKVWKAVTQVPFGETTSYQEIANRIGNPKSVRAIGQANKANKLPIIIPCHRIIGKNGAMTGYAGPHINIKVELLELEKEKNNIKQPILSNNRCR